MIENLKCPLCNGPMQARTNKTTGQKFWGCKDFPRCKGTRNTDGESHSSRPEPTDPEGGYEELPSDRWRNRDKRRW